MTAWTSDELDKIGPLLRVTGHGEPGGPWVPVCSVINLTSSKTPDLMLCLEKNFGKEMTTGVFYRQFRSIKRRRCTGEERPFIVPSLMFVGDVVGRAEEAINFYLSVFNDSNMGALVRYGPGQEPDKEGTVTFADFMLEGQWFAAMDSAREHNSAFNEALSFLVHCDTQEEIDHYWNKLSAVPEAEQCGWLKDKFGVSWQIVPAVKDEMMTRGSREQIDRVTQAFLPMKKLEIAKLKEAYDGK
jgi:predicted 3-demethylubiquinone-9 3-methyltransferase (glyoxalase superfamily)